MGLNDAELLKTGQEGGGQQEGGTGRSKKEVRKQREEVQKIGSFMRKVGWRTVRWRWCKSWEEKQKLVPIFFTWLCFRFALKTPNKFSKSVAISKSCPPTRPPPCCTVNPSIVTQPLTRRSFFYSSAAFPPLPESIIVVCLCFFLRHNCVSALPVLCSSVHVEIRLKGTGTALYVHASMTPWWCHYWGNARV